jgi:U3 small nucleolar RNA-associated protein 6
MSATNENMDEIALRKLESVPPHSAAIPIVILDEALSHFNNDPSLVQEFMAILDDYQDLPASHKILCHILDRLQQKNTEHWLVDACEIQITTWGISGSSVEFPPAFRQCIKKLREARLKLQSGESFGIWAKEWLQKTSELNGIDPALQTVAIAVQASL